MCMDAIIHPSCKMNTSYLIYVDKTGPGNYKCTWLVLVATVFAQTYVLAINVGNNCPLVSFSFRHIDGWVQVRRNSSALAMELCLSCANPSIWNIWPFMSAKAFCFRMRLYALWCYIIIFTVILCHFGQNMSISTTNNKQTQHKPSHRYTNFTFATHCV